MATKTKAKHAADQADEAANVYGTPGADQLAGPDDTEPMTLETLFGEGVKRMLPAKDLEPLDGRDPLDWPDEWGIHANPEYADPRDQIGLPPGELRARQAEHKAAIKSRVDEIGAEVDEMRREQANMPYIIAAQRLEAKRAQERGEAERAQLDAAELDRLARLSGETVPSNQQDYERQAGAALTKFHGEVIRDYEPAAIHAAAVKTLERFQTEHKSTPTAKTWAALTARELEGEGDDEPDNSRTEGLGDDGNPYRGKPDKSKDKGADMFDDLKIIQRKMGLIH